MLSAVRMAILAASTVGACSDTSRIFLSTNSASSRMYAGSPAARTEYVWPKISTCVTDGLGAIFLAPRRENNTPGQAGRPVAFDSSSIFRRRSMRARTAARSASCFARAAAAPPFFSPASRADASSVSRRAFSPVRPFTTCMSDSRRDSIASRTSSREASACDSALPSLWPLVSFTWSSSGFFLHAVHFRPGKRVEAPGRRIPPCVHVVSGERALGRSEAERQGRLHETIRHAGTSIAALRLHGHELRGRGRARGRLERLPGGRDLMSHGDVHLASGETGRGLDGRDVRRQESAEEIEIEVGDDGIREIPRGGERRLEDADPTGVTPRDPHEGRSPGGKVRRKIFFEGERTGGKAEALEQRGCDTRPFEEIVLFGRLRPVVAPPPREQDPDPLPFQDPFFLRVFSLRIPAERGPDFEEREVLLAAQHNVLRALEEPDHWCRAHRRERLSERVLDDDRCPGGGGREREVLGLRDERVGLAFEQPETGEEIARAVRDESRDPGPRRRVGTWQRLGQQVVPLPAANFLEEAYTAGAADPPRRHGHADRVALADRREAERGEDFEHARRGNVHTEEGRQTGKAKRLHGHRGLVRADIDRPPAKRAPAVRENEARF